MKNTDFNFEYVNTMFDAETALTDNFRQMREAVHKIAENAVARFLNEYDARLNDFGKYGGTGTIDFSVVREDERTTTFSEDFLESLETVACEIYQFIRTPLDVQWGRELEVTYDYSSGYVDFTIESDILGTMGYRLKNIHK